MDVEAVKLNIPLEDGSVYVYLAEVGDSRYLIDAGFCSESHAEEIERFADLKSVKVLITHHHIDHVGMVFHRNVQAFMHPSEIEFLEIYTRNDMYVRSYLKICKDYGVPQEYVSPIAILSFMNLELVASIRSVYEVNSGISGISAIHCPGHTKGHTCYYGDKVLFAGDAVLEGTTPNVSPYVTSRGVEGDAVGDYIQSLRKLRDLEIDVIYPAHGRVIRDPERRIEDLLEHYVSRAREIHEIAKGGWMKLEEIASEVEWTVGRYNDLGTFHRFLAVGETLSFLRYLKARGMVDERIIDGVHVFRSLDKSG